MACTIGPAEDLASAGCVAFVVAAAPAWQLCRPVGFELGRPASVGANAGAGRPRRSQHSVGTSGHVSGGPWAWRCNERRCAARVTAVAGDNHRRGCGSSQNDFSVSYSVLPIPGALR